MGRGPAICLMRWWQLSLHRKQQEEDDSIKIAIVGKPNAGKSSLLNKLVGEERAIVSPIPGTTRDATDTNIDFNGLQVTLIDTAGIRKRGKIEHGVEQYSVLRSFKAIERADVALLMIDATTGITAQDAHIAGFILDEWKSCVVIVNKWDAVEKDSFTMEDFTRKIRADLELYGLCPAVVHLRQDGSTRGPGAADGIACAGGTPGTPDDIQDQRSDPQSAGRASTPLPRGTTVEDVLRHPGPLRPANVHDLCQ